MKIIVTGGAGFIGSHVVDRYIELGHKVIVVDDLSSGKKEFINKRAQFYQIDITDREKVEQVFRREKPDVLNHHAAQIEVRRSVADPSLDAKINILGLICLLEAGRKHGLKQVIFASSGGAIYGDTEVLPTPETHPAAPSSPYGITKLASEYYLDYYHQVYNISYISLRYGNVYGPRQNPHGEAGVVAIFSLKLLKNEQPVINGDGTQTRDFVYVKDVVFANELSLDTSEHLIVNIGTGDATDINLIFQHLVSITQTSFQPVHGKKKKGEQENSVLDSKLAKKELGWSPSVSLRTGLLKTVEYFKTHHHPQ